FDDGPAFLVNNVKGYPHARMIANLYNNRQRVAKILGVDDYKKAKFKIKEALKNPIPPRIVQEGPSQELFIPREEVDPFTLFPMIKHTEIDGGRFFGSGVHLITGKYFMGGSQISLYRMSFRGKDYASINMVPGGHGDLIADTFPEEKIPCTVNICPSPAVELTAMGSFIAAVLPPGVDELGIAGALQGSPVELVRAKTVDAYAIANAEWVIEGYIVPYERVWETEAAEKSGQQGVHYFHPEWARYMGRAYRQRKFEVTAVTRRKDRPLYFVPFFGAPWNTVSFRLAAWLELFERLAPRFVIDVNCFLGLTEWGGLVIQVRKRRRSDEGMQRNILAAALGTVRGLRLAVIVDEDIDIYNPEDIIWAITTRLNPETGIMRGPAGGRGQAYQPSERLAAGAEKGTTRPVSVFEGGLGLDCTVPLMAKEQFLRPHYAVDKVDLRKWFTDEEMKEMRAQQGEYFRFLAEKGYA
ncbi:MAG TPA: UbiD family decarboxylase, partial [Dehalococcoidia bacterium]|nr:UbiD family decarboxylase [Dehalococcoidia bacterium]